MSEKIAIKVDHVSKAFKLPHEKKTSIKSLVIGMFHGKRTYERQLALDDISFEVKEGEFFGIVGRNGSGKSTLLKLLAGIYTPDQGGVQVNGKLTPFIELGVGFNQELTGRENVFLNGALLGFNRSEMAAMYDEIVEFAELERFMDQKLKNYSSGMQVRLAFSIAIRAKTDILLIDEVLAVGDTAFQRKCLQYFETLKQQKKTVVFVTHDMGSVERYCTKVLVVDKSKQLGVFSALEAKNLYDEINATGEVKQSKKEDKEVEAPRRWGNKNIEIEKVQIFSDGKEVDGAKQPVEHGKSFKVTVTLKHNQKADAVVGLAVYDDQDVNLSGPNSGKVKIGDARTVSYELEKLSLNAGQYNIALGVFDQASLEEFDYMPSAVSLRVVDSGIQKFGKVDLFGSWEAK